MLCIVIKGPSYVDAAHQIEEAWAIAEMVELRLDAFSLIDKEAIRQLRARFPLPMVFTLKRDPMEGGIARLMQELRELIELAPEFLDIDYSLPAECIREILAHSSRTRLILSYHDFEGIPPDLELLYQRMIQVPGVIYKLAVTPRSAIEAIRFLLWARRRREAVIAIGMGLEGQLTRILSKWIGNTITYASIDSEQPSAPGQLPGACLVQRYNYRQMSRSTALYGLVGDPVSQSISDATHNVLFRAWKKNAVYLKMRVCSGDLPAFLDLAKQVPFQGMSVTMPHKEAAVACVDDLDPAARRIGAVNTLKFDGGRILGYNTDGIGALNAIESLVSVEGKKIVVLGAGGAARAITDEALRRGAQVLICSRNPEKAAALCARFGCRGQGIEVLQRGIEGGYDLIINATSHPDPVPIDALIPGSLAMEVATRPKITPFLKKAMDRNCSPIFGYQMFIEQALGQFRIWFPEEDPIDMWRRILQAAAEAELSGTFSVDSIAWF